MQVLPTGDQQAEKQEREVPLAIAVVGRPNVGKSSLVNAITGTDRAIVSSMSGTTRDAVDTEVILPDGTPINLIDTAGIRKRAKVVSSADGAEPISVVRAIRCVPPAACFDVHACRSTLPGLICLPALMCTHKEPIDQLCMRTHRAPCCLP